MTRIEFMAELREMSFEDAPCTGYIRSCVVEQVIKVTFNRGLGVPSDPVRVVSAWYTMGGDLIAEQDMQIPQKIQARAE